MVSNDLHCGEEELRWRELREKLKEDATGIQKRKHSGIDGGHYFSFYRFL